MQKHDYPFEIIIADDHSTDNTIEIIKGYASKHPEITFLPVQPNLGITKITREASMHVKENM